MHTENEANLSAWRGGGGPFQMHGLSQDGTNTLLSLLSPLKLAQEIGVLALVCIYLFVGHQQRAKIMEHQQQKGNIIKGYCCLIKYTLFHSSTYKLNYYLQKLHHLQ